jgi:hypothetical protein
MSDRERWIVYPLLFLAIGASLRDKLFDRTTSKSIVCQELIVVDDNHNGRQPVRVLARIGGTDRSADHPEREGQMFVDGQLLVDQARVGTIVADNYLYRGIPFTPTLHAIFPGVSPADLLQALQKSAEALQGGAKTSSPTPQPGGAKDGNKPPAETTPRPQPPAQAPTGGDDS